MKQATKSKRIIAIIFIIIITFFFCFIMLRAVTRTVLVKHYGLSNSIIDLILFDVNAINNGEDFTETNAFHVDWEVLYPFADEEQVNKKNITNEIENHLKQYNKKFENVKTRIEPYVTDYLAWRTELTELANGYENLLNWNIVSYSEYNGITIINEQYLASLSAEVNVSEVADSTIEFASFCKEHGIDFLYAQQPSKICKYEDPRIYGSTDYSNQNMDSFLQLLTKAGVDTYDHRKDIHEEGLNHHDLFYNTDHHWKAETGLWASQHIINYLNDKFDYNLDSSILDSDNYSYDVYRNWFLGSQGKKVTLERAEPEDFTIIHPKYETSLHYQIPNLEIDEYGSFDITYDMDNIDTIDYYNKNPYAAYNHADRPLIRIENKLIDKGPSVLIIHNSFANCEIPFFAMSVKYVDCIDLRQFDGSVRSYIEQTNPDIVIVTYNYINDSINWETNTDIFDFR